MVKRTLNNGTVIIQEASPNCPGHIYYVEGPDGKAPVMDTCALPMKIVSACVAWELDDAVVDHPGPKPDFNKSGFNF